MTSTIDSDAQKAALLVKTTAESTATAMNIAQIQKDLGEIKQSLKEMAGIFVSKIEFTEVVKVQEDHERRTRLLEQNMWKLIGVSSVGGAGVVTLITQLMQ